MQSRRDPVERATDGDDDLYDVATWESRSWLDRLSVRVYGGVVAGARIIVVLLALLIVGAQVASIVLATQANPAIGVFTLLSVVPALAIAVYLWRTDVTRREPLTLLVGTFLLGILFAGFAAILNTSLRGLFVGVPLVGMALFFYLVVAPVEETVKWLAIRLYAFRSDDFGAVLDGAVYGAMAGLGFATIENAIYIGGQYADALQAGTVSMPLFEAALPTAAVRSFAGPGHVIYSAFAGYYLGLAKFNRENAGPIVVKGLLIAAFLHATYNTLVGIVPYLVHAFYPAIAVPIAFIGFVIVYDGILGYALYRKISRYRRAFHRSGASGLGEDRDVTDDPDDGGRSHDPDDGDRSYDPDDGDRSPDQDDADVDEREDGHRGEDGMRFPGDDRKTEREE